MLMVQTHPQSAHVGGQKNSGSPPLRSYAIGGGSDGKARLEVTCGCKDNSTCFVKALTPVTAAYLLHTHLGLSSHWHTKHLFNTSHQAMQHTHTHTHTHMHTTTRAH